MNFSEQAEEPMFDSSAEPDWHQQDKDNRAQGMDRDPEPPEDDRPPLDLDTVDRHYRAALDEDLRGVPEHAEHALAAVPELLVRLRAAEEELAEWRALPYRDEFSVYRPCRDECDCEGARTWFTEPDRALAASKRLAGSPQGRRIYTGPWEELQTSPF